MGNLTLFVLLASVVVLGYIIYVLLKDLRKVVYDHERLKVKHSKLEDDSEVEIKRLQGVCARLRAPKSIEHNGDSEIWKRMSNLAYIRISDGFQNQFEAMRGFNDIEGISLEELCLFLESLDYCFQTPGYRNRRWCFGHAFEVKNTEGAFVSVYVEGVLEYGKESIKVICEGEGFV